MNLSVNSIQAFRFHKLQNQLHTRRGWVGFLRFLRQAFLWPTRMLNFCRGSRSYESLGVSDSWLVKFYAFFAPFASFCAVRCSLFSNENCYSTAMELNENTTKNPFKSTRVATRTTTTMTMMSPACLPDVAPIEGSTVWLLFLLLLLYPVPLRISESVRLNHRDY